MISPRDPNFVPTIIGVSSADFLTPTTIAVDPTTHALLADVNAVVSQVEVWDGTNAVNILKSDGTAAGQNSLMVSPTARSITATASAIAAVLVASQDVSNYKSFCWQGDGGGSGVTIVAEGSNDNSTWVALNWGDPTNLANISGSSGSASEVRNANITTRYLRIRLSTISSGTQGGRLILSTMPITPGTGVVQSGTWTVNSALSSSPLINQKKIAVTGTAVQLQSNTLVNGVIITAYSGNTNPITIGGSGVTNTFDGTGNGYILEAGSSVSFGVTNTNVLYINGTSGDYISFAGS